MTELRDQLRAALTAGMRARDRAAVSALRSAIAALDNAEAVARPDPGADVVVGIGATEAERRTLSDAEEGAIIDAELAELAGAVATYERLGDQARADSARVGHAALAGSVAGPARPA